MCILVNSDYGTMQKLWKNIRLYFNFVQFIKTFQRINTAKKRKLIVRRKKNMQSFNWAWSLAHLPSDIYLIQVHYLNIFHALHTCRGGLRLKSILATVCWTIKQSVWTLCIKFVWKLRLTEKMFSVLQWDSNHNGPLILNRSTVWAIWVTKILLKWLDVKL